MNQQLRATVPKGLSQLSAATLTKQSAAGLSTPIAGLQLLTDSSTGLPYWSYHNSLPADNFTEANTQFTLQYTATVTEEWINQFLLFSARLLAMMVAERQLRQSLKNNLYLSKTVPSVLCRCQLQFFKIYLSPANEPYTHHRPSALLSSLPMVELQNTMAFVGKRVSPCIQLLQIKRSSKLSFIEKWQ